MQPATATMDAPARPHWAWLLATVLASALLAWFASQPPRALPADAPAGEL